MICPNCGAEVAGNVNFCESCGAPIEGSAPSARPASSGMQAQQPLGQTQVMPPQSDQRQSWQQPRQPGAYGAAPAQPSAAPFVLAIIALVTAVLGLFPVSIVLAIVALVMNSGQKKRGEESTKQTPTTVMGVVSLILSAIALAVTVMLGGLIITAVLNGDIDPDDFGDAPASSASSGAAAPSSSSAASSSAEAPSEAGSSSASGSSSATGSSSAAESSSSTPSSAAGPAITGTDDLVGTWKLTEMVDDGEVASADDIELMQNMGFTVALDMNQDGTCTLDLFGVEAQGTWEATGPGTVRLVLDDETVDCAIDVDTGKLSMEDGDDQLTFTKQ